MTLFLQSHQRLLSISNVWEGVAGRKCEVVVWAQVMKTLACFAKT